ncbi:cell wall surface anchor family protein [Streptococcus pneumoniae]|nr:cell wall surface anchor family protein [Streptococcus pneumoniae]
MKYFVPNEVFSIRKLKVGTCSVLLAISILGSQGILSDEVVTSSSPMATKESSNAITNDLDNSPTVNQNRSAEMIASNSTTNGLDNSLSVNSISSNGTIRSNSQLDNRTVESTVTSTNENKSYKEDVISDRIIKKEFEDTALSVKDYGAVGDGIHDDRQAIQDAIDAAAQGLGGGNVYFPEGTYLVKEIVFLKSHTHLELNEKATILNGINIKNHPSIVFMTGLFTDDGAQVEWGPTEDISYSGGTIDMNGALNEEGTKAKNLPLINSSGAFAIGNSNNVTIKNVTFKDSYQGHAIQIAGSKNVLVDNSRFLGQALPKTDNAKNGMKIYLTDKNKVYTYEIREVKRVTPDRVDEVDDRDGVNEITLVTCEDLAATERIIVKGDLKETKDYSQTSNEILTAFNQPYKQFY